MLLGLVKKLYVINEHYIKYMVRDLSVFDAFSNTDLEAWADTFYDYYMVSKDFRIITSIIFKKVNLKTIHGK